MLIYSGMVAEAFVTMGHWSNNHGAGIRPYINAICRTGEGTRFGTFATYDYQSAFGIPSPEGPVATPKTPSVTPTPTPSVTPTPTPSVTPTTPPMGNTTLASLLKGRK
jgi:cell division septation protein DedD